MHKHQKAILKAIKANPNATLQQLGQVIGSESFGQVQHHINMLLKSGVIERGTKWVVLEKKK